jgi:hypothetical protein
LKVPRTSRVYAEIRLPVWKDGIANSTIVEGAHSDAVPMARYACILAKPYLPDTKADEP